MLAALDDQVLDHVQAVELYPAGDVREMPAARRRRPANADAAVERAATAENPADRADRWNGFVSTSPKRVPDRDGAELAEGAHLATDVQ